MRLLVLTLLACCLRPAEPSWSSKLPRSPRGWQASLEASEKLFEKVKQSGPVEASLEASGKILRSVKQSAQPLTSGVTSLLHREKQSQPKLKFLPSFLRSSKVTEGLAESGSQSAEPSQLEESPATPVLQEILGPRTSALQLDSHQEKKGLAKESIQVHGKPGFSYDQLLLPAMAVVLLSLLAGYLAGKGNLGTAPSLHEGHSMTNGVSEDLKTSSPNKEATNLLQSTVHPGQQEESQTLGSKVTASSTVQTSGPNPTSTAARELESVDEAGERGRGGSPPAEPVKGLATDDTMTTSSVSGRRCISPTSASVLDSDDKEEAVGASGQTESILASSTSEQHAMTPPLDVPSTAGPLAEAEQDRADRSESAADSRVKPSEEPRDQERQSSGKEASTSYASLPPGAQQGREPGGMSPGWLQDRENKQSGTAGLEAVDGVSVVMEALAARLKLDTDAMTPQERMQLLQMALQCCQHREQSWLAAHANEIRQSQADSALGLLSHKRQEAEGRESRRQVQHLSTLMQDGLLSGLVLMMVITLFCGVKCGYLGRRLGRCPSISSLPSPSFWRPWVALEVFSIFWCWFQASSEALLGFAIILGVAWAAIRGGVYQGTTFKAPLLKLGIGLGLICGLAGYIAVGKMGGEANRWFLCWQTWVALHMTAAWQLPLLQISLSSGAWQGPKKALYHTCLSFMFPIAIAALPFQGCAYSLLSLKSIVTALLMD